MREEFAQLRTMETQRMLDALTDHLAIYHRSSVTKTKSRARQALVEWITGLNCEQRRAALTVVDTSWVAILLMMQKYLRAEGTCTFFLLPDVPVTEGESSAAGTKTTRNSKEKLDDYTSHGKGTRSSKLVGSKATEGAFCPTSGKRADIEFRKCASPLPGLCFRRARGLVKRLETRQTSGDLLVNSIRLSSSRDGEDKTTLGSLDSMVDCITVTEDFIANMGTFLEIMDDLSHHEFLNSPFLSAASPWEEMPWLKAMGYYSMPAFIANKFEFGLWSAWSRAQGTKRLPRSLASKTKDTQNGWISSSSSCYLSGNAAFAASVFGRKQGCVDWWRKLGNKERANVATCTVALATKSEVLKIVREARAAVGKVNDLKPRSRLKAVSRDPGKARLNTACRTSLSDSEVEQTAKLRTADGQVAAFAPCFTGLQALKEISESGFLCGKREGLKSIQEDDASWLFDSTLDSVHTFSDRVRRKARDVLVKVRNDHIELELLGDERSSKTHRGDGGETSGVKVAKTKKKRRKNTSSKTEVLKEEEVTCKSISKLPKEERKQQEHTGSCSFEAEVQVGNSGVDQILREVKSMSGGKQHCSRKGKGGKLKVKTDEKTQQPNLLSQKCAMDDEDLAGQDPDNINCFSVSLENCKGPCSNCEGPATSGDSPLDCRPSLKVPVKCPARLIGQYNSEKSSSSSSICNLGEEKPGKWQDIPSPVIDSLSNKKISNRDPEEMPSEDSVSIIGPGPSPGEPDSSQTTLSLQCATFPILQEPIEMQDCPPIRHMSHLINKLEDGTTDQLIFDTHQPVFEADSIPVIENQISACGAKKDDLESSSICFGTVDAALPELQKTSSVSVFSNPSGKATAHRLCSNANGSDKLEDATCQVVQDKGKEKILATGQSSWEGGFEITPSDVKPIPQSPNGMLRFTKNFRQLDYSNSQQAHYQQGPPFRSSPHEWPGSPQFGYFGAYHQPTATDWLQLDVGRGWPQRMESTLLTYRSAPVLRQQSAQAESPTLRTVASRTTNVGSVERPPLVHPSYNISPAGGYSITTKEEPRLNVRPLFNPSPFSSGYGEVEANSQGQNIDDLENEDRLAYDTDVDDYGIYKSGDFDDLDGYMISEEEGDRYLEDAAENSSADYHQIFGGGVMYWNAADYAGLGYSRPGSLSSDDSSWARHEADLSAVLGDIVNYQPIQGSYPGKGPTGSNVPSCSPSPPSSSSVPITFEHLSPVASSNPRHCLPRPTGKEFPGKFVQLSNQGLTTEDQSLGARVPITLEVIEQIRADSSQPILRPIVVVRDLSLSRQVSAGEALRLQEAKSPHIVPRSRRDLAGHRKRPPSPVLRCVPPAPPPPPPSPVAGPRRRKGLMAARSGSSSPRHWGLVNWPYKDELGGPEGSVKGESPEGLLTTGRRRGSITSTPPMHPLSGALLRERLVSIPPLSLEEDHPDASIPMKTTLLHNSNSALHLCLTKLLSTLHVEIEAFSWQVEMENKMRKPFINMAVKKVAHSLQVLWPRSRINIFGSIATGLALPTSDVDLVVCLPPVRNLEPIKEAGILEGRNGIKETSLQHAARYLADQDWVKNDSMKTIENTPVPIIMMVAEFLPHQCEMGDEDTPYSFRPSIRKETCEEATNVENRAVLSPDSVSCKEDKNIVTEDMKGPWGGKSARQLVHLDISFETPSHTGLRTAELVRELVGQYPALSPLALVLKQFLTDRSLDHPYTGGLSSYCLVLLITRFLQHQHHHGKPSSNQNLGRLFMDFLHFFGCVFDPRRMGVRIRGGGMYVSRDRYNDIDPLYIEDPLHPDNNVGRNCFRILQCVKAFADGYAVLEKKLHDLSSGPEDLRKGVECLELLQLMLPCINMTK